MKRAILTAALSIILVTVFGAQLSSAQGRERRLNATPKAFQTFFAKFSASVVSGDRQAVVSMTQFPFKYGWDAGDEGTYNRTQFKRKYAMIFDGARKLFSQRNPTLYVDGGSYNLTNEEDASHYIFERTKSGYKFTAIISEP